MHLNTSRMLLQSVNKIHIFLDYFFAPFCMARTTTVSGSHTSAYTFDKATVRRQAKGKIMEAKL